MASIIHAILLFFIAISNGDDILFHDALLNNTSFELSDSVEITFDSLCSVHSCARIPITNPASYLKSTSVDTTNHMDLTLQIDIAILGMTFGSFTIYTADSTGSVLQIVTTFNTSSMTMNQNQIYRNMTYDLDPINENRSEIILYFEALAPLFNDGAVFIDNVYILGRSIPNITCTVSQVSECCYPGGLPTDNQLSVCWQIGCQYSNDTDSCDITAPAFYQCIHQCDGNITVPTLLPTTNPTDSPTNGGTESPTTLPTDSPSTKEPTVSPTTKRPTPDPSTSNPTVNMIQSVLQFDISDISMVRNVRIPHVCSFHMVLDSGFCVMTHEINCRKIIECRCTPFHVVEKVGDSSCSFTVCYLVLNPSFIYIWYLICGELIVWFVSSDSFHSFTIQIAMNLLIQ